MAEVIRLSEMKPEDLAERLKISLKQAQVMIARAKGEAKPHGEKFPK
jgi:hypothetical protein